MYFIIFNLIYNLLLCVNTHTHTHTHTHILPPDNIYWKQTEHNVEQKWNGYIKLRVIELLWWSTKFNTTLLSLKIFDTIQSGLPLLSHNSGPQGFCNLCVIELLLLRGSGKHLLLHSSLRHSDIYKYPTTAGCRKKLPLA